MSITIWEFLSQSAKHSGEKTDLLTSAALSLLLNALIMNTLLGIEHTCMLASAIYCSSMHSVTPGSSLHEYSLNMYGQACLRPDLCFACCFLYVISLSLHNNVLCCIMSL